MLSRRLHCVITAITVEEEPRFHYTCSGFEPLTLLEGSLGPGEKTPAIFTLRQELQN